MKESHLLGTVCFCLFSIIPTVALSGSYTFAPIAISGSTFDNFGDSPAINNSGYVTFTGAFNSYNDSGVYVGSGGSLQTIADTTGAFLSLSSPVISNTGTVSFNGRTLLSPLPLAYSDAIYSGQIGSSVVTKTVDDVGIFDRLFVSSINNSNSLAFSATLTSGDFGVYRKDSSGVNEITTNSGTLDPGSFATILNDGSVLFHARNSTPSVNDGFYLGDGTTITPSLEADGSPFFGFGERGSINENGQLIVAGYTDPFGEDRGVWTFDGISIDPIADRSDGFNAFGSPDINNNGDYIFRAILEDGTEGIFTGPDLTNDAVIKTGDPLFGSTVQGVVKIHPNQAINDSGQIAFYTSLVDGRIVVAVANPVVPIPPAVWLFGSGLLGLIGIARRKTNA